MKRLLEDLRKTNLVKVTGSYADGTQNEKSDIDFYVKEDHPDWKFLGKKRNIEVIKAILDKHKVYVESSVVGYWYSHQSLNNIPIQIEFSDLFKHRKNRLKEVEIMGVKFRTW